VILATVMVDKEAAARANPVAGGTDRGAVYFTLPIVDGSIAVHFDDPGDALSWLQHTLTEVRKIINADQPEKDSTP